MRMDTQVSTPISETVGTDLYLRELPLRRIEAELRGAPFLLQQGDRPSCSPRFPPSTVPTARQSESAGRRTRDDGQGRTGSQRSDRDGVAPAQTLPIYREQEAAHDKLVKDGFVSKLGGLDRSRERIEKEQELKAQGHQVASLRASIEQSRKRLAQIGSTYRQQLQTERAKPMPYG
jgi:HlyD family secretion protein